MLFQKYPHPDYPETWIFYKNQGDVQQYAKSIGDKKAEHAVQADINLNKDDVLEMLNAHQEEIRSFLRQQDRTSQNADEANNVSAEETSTDAPAVEEPKPAPAIAAPSASPPGARSYLQSDIIEAINDADPSLFGRILEASICRLGELRTEGWDVFASLSTSLDLHNNALERGLGSLVLAAVMTAEDPQGEIIQRLRKRKPKTAPVKRGFGGPAKDEGI